MLTFEVRNFVFAGINTNVELFVVFFKLQIFKKETTYSNISENIKGLND